MTQRPSLATAFAPASVGNVAVGFDILGFAVDALGDRVTVSRRDRPGVEIASVRGVAGALPLEPSLNTAGKALLTMQEVVAPPFGFVLEIEKGIPLGSGLGGSAASAVAAVVAANALLPQPQSDAELLKFAMRGEAVASGALHADNVAPSLFGGMVLTVGVEEPRVTRIPIPAGVRAVLIHPHMFLSTKEARALLQPTVALEDFIAQSGNLAGFIAGCFRGDLDLIRASFKDVIVEPQRRLLIPGFAEVRGAAMNAGALGCSISGAGPTVFAWALQEEASHVLAAMRAQFAARDLEVDEWIVDADSQGARLLSGGDEVH